MRSSPGGWPKTKGLTDLPHSPAVYESRSATSGGDLNVLLKLYIVLDDDPLLTQSHFSLIMFELSL